MATIPLPVQIVIDDVGWWTAADGSAVGEPYRSDMPRPHVPADYSAIVELGRRLGMRPQAAMMLCDWDRDLLLRQLPEATWMGAAWDNPWRRHPHLDEAARILNDGANDLELVVHGLAHEWWGDTTMQRAEWADREGVMRPRHVLERHLDTYAAILERNDLGPLPPSFVPCAFCHAFGDGGAGVHGLLADHGITYVSTPFRSMRQRRTPQMPRIAVECGVMTVDRGGGAPPWNAAAATPPATMSGPIVGLHWPNILHADPERNEEVVDAWVTHLRHVGNAPDRWLAPDTPRAWSQLAHAEGTRIADTAAGLAFDFDALDELGATAPLDHFVIKTADRERPRFAAGVHVLAESWDGASGCWVSELQRDRSGRPAAGATTIM
jgi:hypothetical protein